MCQLIYSHRATALTRQWVASAVRLTAANCIFAQSKQSSRWELNDWIQFLSNLEKFNAILFVEELMYHKALDLLSGSTIMLFRYQEPRLSPTEGVRIHSSGSCFMGSGGCRLWEPAPWSVPGTVNKSEDGHSRWDLIPTPFILNGREIQDHRCMETGWFLTP